jgi:hypothetical protein
MPSFRIAILAAALLLAAPAAAEDCTAAVAPDRDRGVLGDLVFYDFGAHYELQIETPAQPSGIGFEIALDGAATDAVLAFSGLDDIALSLATADGDLALDLAFLPALFESGELTALGYRDGALVTFASYDLRELAAGLVACGLV